MGAFRITGNLLMSFGLYWGVVALLYGGTDVSKSMVSGSSYATGYVPSEPRDLTTEQQTAGGGDI